MEVNRLYVILVRHREMGFERTFPFLQFQGKRRLFIGKMCVCVCILLILTELSAYEI